MCSIGVGEEEVVGGQVDLLDAGPPPLAAYPGDELPVPPPRRDVRLPAQLQQVLPQPVLPHLRHRRLDKLRVAAVVGTVAPVCLSDMVTTAVCPGGAPGPAVPGMHPGALGVAPPLEYEGEDAGHAGIGPAGGEAAPAGAPRAVAPPVPQLVVTTLVRLSGAPSTSVWAGLQCGAALVLLPSKMEWENTGGSSIRTPHSPALGAGPLGAGDPTSKA